MADTDIIEGRAALVSEKPSADERCGNCKFAMPIPEDLKVIECRGAPPTPAIMGMGPNGPAVGLLRARLPRAEKACALWKFKSAIVL